MSQGGRVIHRKCVHQPKELARTVRAMDLFARIYDGHMFGTNHYERIQAGVMTLHKKGLIEGNREINKVGDFGCGSGVVLGKFITSVLCSRIVDVDSRRGPLKVYGVDATESMLMLAQARLFRRMDNILSNHPDMKLFAYGIDIKSGDLVRFNSTLRRKEQPWPELLKRMMVCREDPDGKIKADGKHLKELLRVELILKDVLALNEQQKKMLENLDLAVVSYCFHWFHDKLAVARLISSLLELKNGRHLSIEEWRLRVSPPQPSPGATLSESALAFHRDLGNAIDAATTPICVPKDLYALFAEAGLELIGSPHTERIHDNLEDMEGQEPDKIYFGMFRKATTANAPVRQLPLPAMDEPQKTRAAEVGVTEQTPPADVVEAPAAGQKTTQTG